jgi:hypothetical protein
LSARPSRARKRSDARLLAIGADTGQLARAVLARASSLAPLLLLLACSGQPPSAPTDAPSAASAAPPPVVSAAPPPTVSAAPPPVVTAEPSAVPSAAPSAAPTAETPLPAVKVSNIGIHIGGGPNDDVTKDPIRRSVHPHFDEFRRCWSLAEDPKKVGEVSLDLRIEKAGGKPQVKRVGGSAKGKEFKECVVKVFEGIDFLKPKGGTTTVSYSLRFTPGK